MRTQYEVFLAQLASKDLVTNYSTRDFEIHFVLPRCAGVLRVGSILFRISFSFANILLPNNLSISVNIKSYKHFFSFQILQYHYYR